jgi:NADP-dependent 3-hydroxy acid dehydrogenase YdfG
MKRVLSGQRAFKHGLAPVSPAIRRTGETGAGDFAISPDAVAHAIAFAVEQPYDVEIGDITIRPAVQG